MIPAYAYARYSSDNQREESIESQLAMISEFAARNGYKISQTFVDAAISGTKVSGREQFQNMLSEAIRSKTVSAILVLDLSRYARNAEEAIHIENQLLRANIELVSISQPMRTRLENGKLNTSALTYRRMMHVMNEAQSLQNSDTTSAHMMSQSQRPNEMGYHPHMAGSAPYGYKLSERKHYKDHRYLEVNEDEAPAVRLAWQWCSEGIGYREIAKRLGELGYRSRRGAILSHTSVYEMLHNSTYAGIYSYGKVRYNRLTTGVPEENPDAVVVPGGCPAIIPMALYEQVSTLLSGRKYGPRTSRGTLYILSGLVRCKYCGSPMCGDSGGKNRETTYRCNGKECDHRQWRTSRPLLERAVLRALMDTFIIGARSDDIAAALNELDRLEGQNIEGQIRRLRNEITAAERKILSLMDLMSDLELRDITKKKILELQSGANVQKCKLREFEELQRKKNINNDTRHVFAVLCTAQKAYAEWDEPKLKTIANIFIENVEVAHLGDIKITWSDGTNLFLSPSPPDPSNPKRRALKASRNTGYCSMTLGTANKVKSGDILSDIAALHISWRRASPRRGCWQSCTSRMAEGIFF